MKVTLRYRCYCRKCGGYSFNLLTGFIHDVRCYSLETAIHNIKQSLQADLGLIEIETERDYLERMGLDLNE